MTGIGCARAASGHAAVAPPTSVMNSRRFFRSPRRQGRVAECLRGFEVDDEFEIRRLQYWQVGRLRAFKDLASVNTGLTIGIRNIGGSPEPIYASSLTVRKKRVVVELWLPFVWTPAFGIKCAIFRLNLLKALGGFRDGSSHGEIIRLAFDYKPVSPSWEYKVFILWLNH